MSNPAGTGDTTQDSLFLDYHLPQHLIAQHPAARRDQSRLLVMYRHRDELEHRHFADLPEYLAAGDLLVLNDSKVVPARLLGTRAETGGRWEGLFLQATADGVWELLCQTRGRLRLGETILVEPGPLRLTLEGRHEGHWLARPDLPGSPWELLERHGQVPLPPYIRRGRAQRGDRDRYQTVYARTPGSVAAPTAGLHFTPELLDQLERQGIQRASVTLHVGVGTFQPIKEQDFTRHRMHQEWCELPAATVEAINACKARGGRVIAVGTTTVRTLEAVAASGPLRPWRGVTDHFIYPPYDFRVIDALVTNFHLPRSTLLLLVAAFAGSERIRRAYAEAVAREYRFYSYGDATLIL
jgi:S-adenosylmethionine:tRNA ribosyltransferase-isomerase